MCNIICLFSISPDSLRYSSLTGHFSEAKPTALYMFGQQNWTLAFTVNWQDFLPKWGSAYVSHCFFSFCFAPVLLINNPAHNLFCHLLCLVNYCLIICSTNPEVESNLWLIQDLSVECVTAISCNVLTFADPKCSKRCSQMLRFKQPLTLIGCRPKSSLFQPLPSSVL